MRHRMLGPVSERGNSVFEVLSGHTTNWTAGVFGLRLFSFLLQICALEMYEKMHRIAQYEP
jgi:hypothetical protein